LVLGLSLAAALFFSSCLLRFTLGIEIAETLSEEIELIISAIRTEATTAVCQVDPFFSPNFQRCTYFINGVEVASTTHLLSELGPFGAMIDPVVLELPANVTQIRGTYDGGGANVGRLNVYPGLSLVPIDDSRNLTPSPGNQLVIIDLPNGVPVNGVDYTFDLSFRRTAPKGSGPTPIKAVLTGKVVNGAKTFYPPMLPCTGSMATVPTFTLPRGSAGSALLPVSLPDATGLACNNAVYRYFTFKPACDQDNDADVDQNDIRLIMAVAVRNASASPGDPRDVNGDRIMNANDARFCTARCTRPRCR
jgi:hypothetical protein